MFLLDCLTAWLLLSLLPSPSLLLSPPSPPLVYRVLQDIPPLYTSDYFFPFSFFSLPLPLVVPVTLSLNVLRSIPPPPSFFLSISLDLTAPYRYHPSHSLPAPSFKTLPPPPIHSSAGLSDIDPAHSHASKEANNLHSHTPPLSLPLTHSPNLNSHFPARSPRSNRG